MVFNPGDFIIDISHHNGMVNWQKVKTDPQGVKGVFLKATEGSNVMDKTFFANVQGCEANGIPWGAYHFCTWNNEDEVKDATTEAQFFLSIVKGAKGHPVLPLMIDTESDKAIPYTKDEMVTYVKTFAEVIQAGGYTVGIYGSPGFLMQYYPSNHPFINLPLWVADYGGAINPVPGWKKPWLHQYSPSGSILGIKTKVDVNKII